MRTLEKTLYFNCISLITSVSKTNKDVSILFLYCSLYSLLLRNTSKGLCIFDLYPENRESSVSSTKISLPSHLLLILYCNPFPFLTDTRIEAEAGILRSQLNWSSCESLSDYCWNQSSSLFKEVQLLQFIQSQNIVVSNGLETDVVLKMSGTS